MAEMLVGILVDSLEELNRMITSNYHENREICLRRLEVLAEQAMTCDGVSLDIVDLLNQAKNILRRDVETNIRRIYAHSYANKMAQLSIFFK